MDKYESFCSKAKEFAEALGSIDRKECIRVISHLDADGIAAAAILIKALDRQNRTYSISILQNLNKQAVAGLVDENYRYYVFTDLGSGQMDLIKHHLKDKTVFVFDHHQIAAEHDGVYHFNPELFGISGSNEISGAGVVYFVCREMDRCNEDMAQIAIVGSIGDMQEKNGFMRLNNLILEDAIKQGKISVQRGLRFFGGQTRPLYKVLEYSTDPFIPGVSGTESGAIQFLNQHGINPRNENGWKKMVHLTEEEMQNLIAGVILSRQHEENPDDVLGNTYILLDEEEESPLRDAKEFSTLLNACGRLDKASVGIGACIGDKKMKKEALQISTRYKREIMNIMRWYEGNPNAVIKGNGYMIINTEDNIPPTMVGTLASMLARSNTMEKGTLVLSMSRLPDMATKVSLRIAGQNKGLDLRAVVKKVTGDIKGEFGGHMNAAGALIPTEKEEEFIANAIKVFQAGF